ncbi:MAG: non-histone chromosomal MC1 family protein [Candidatus Altiarchaeota archaeon]|nr:non-histone chromosomal MC1 family protein [Candidatus Altiarchaeota archaeon]MBU4437125.1 non-histone chromosomal MC1 family protein [Candidatus Altiarchaeota archaeon]
MAKKRKKAGMKNYVMKKGKELHVFTGRTPRQAALKAATRGFSGIELRERGRRNADGTYSIHIFSGSVSMVSKPDNAPDWLPAKIKKPVVKKKGVNRVKKI